MKKPFLITTDLHLTNNERDSYRWGLFEWLQHQIIIHDVQRLLILGDITDAKDNHSSRLVNRVVDELAHLGTFCPVDVMMGNHDYLVAGIPFFEFMNHIPNVRFIFEQYEDGNTLFLPHTKNPIESWADVEFNNFDYVFMHQTVSGAVASNGQKMDGELGSKFRSRCKIYSGDIHVPQVIGDVEYVGSPYPVHFGDRFKGRCILINADGTPEDLHFPTIQKFTARITNASELRTLQIKPGDQIKIEVDLPQSMRADWFSVKQELVRKCESIGADICGINLVSKVKKRVLISEGEKHVAAAARGSDVVVRRFAEHEKLAEDLVLVGLELVK